MNKPKFNFIPERQLNKEIAPTGFYVTLTKQRNLVFTKSDVDIYDLDGKHIRLFADVEKKVIGWAVIDGKTELEQLNDARQLKKNPTNGNILLGVGRLLKAMGIEEVKENRKLPVRTYLSVLQAKEIKYLELDPKEKPQE